MEKQYYSIHVWDRVGEDSYTHGELFNEYDNALEQVETMAKEFMDDYEDEYGPLTFDKGGLYINDNHGSCLVDFSIDRLSIAD